MYINTHDSLSGVSLLYTLIGIYRCFILDGN